MLGPRPFCNTDVPAALGDHNDNCCDTDVSLSVKLCRRVYKHVLLPLIPLFFRAHCRQRSCSTLENISNNVNKVSKIQWNNSAPISIDRSEVAMDTTHSTSLATHSVSAQLDDNPANPQGLGVDGDLESNIES
jgi:hypothetical protein